MAAAQSFFSKAKSLLVDNNTWNFIESVYPTHKLDFVTLLSKDGATNELPMVNISLKLRDTKLVVKFIDSFYSGNNVARDNIWLNILRSCPDVVIRKFYGHLDQPGLANLPDTIVELCLAIGSAEDAQRIQNMQTWPELRDLRVSVTPEVAVEHLQALPPVPNRSIYFPHLSDDRVHIVRPAIETLLPLKLIAGVYFPKCMLTSTGLMTVITSLTEIDNLCVYHAICFDMCGSFQPTRREKSDLEELFKEVSYGLKWDMSSIYRVTNPDSWDLGH